MVVGLTIAGVACGAVAGIGFGIAAVIREYYRGKVAMLRAQRGDPELPRDQSALPSLLGKS